jgi:hypothetical protein
MRNPDDDYVQLPSGPEKSLKAETSSITSEDGLDSHGENKKIYGYASKMQVGSRGGVYGDEADWPVM